MHKCNIDSTVGGWIYYLSQPKQQIWIWDDGLKFIQESVGRNFKRLVIIFVHKCTFTNYPPFKPDYFVAKSNNHINSRHVGWILIFDVTWMIFQGSLLVLLTRAIYTMAVVIALIDIIYYMYAYESLFNWKSKAMQRAITVQ